MSSVLIVEDDNNLRVLAHHMLKGLGCQVYEATNGLEGEAAALELNPEMILMDIMMPEQDGYQTTINLRAQQYTGRIILCSALFAGTVEPELHKYGADAYLQKPITRDNLREYVAQLAANQPS